MASKNFGLLVKSKREEARLSQQQLAEMCELHRATIMHIESGRQRVFLDQAVRIAKALNISASEVRSSIERIDQLEFPIEAD